MKPNVIYARSNFIINIIIIISINRGGLVPGEHSNVKVVSGSSKNWRKKGRFFTVEHCTCVTWIGYQIHVKLVWKGMTFLRDLTYLGLFFMQICVKGGVVVFLSITYLG